MSIAYAYKPSLTNARKYGKYLQYLAEYLKYGDFRSLSYALRYMFTHKLPRSGYTTKSALGTFMIRGNTNDFQFINYVYEKSIRDYLSAHMDNFDVFIDVGACIGEYSIWLARNGKRCIAIEPVSYEGVRKNVEINKLGDKVTVFACGAGDRKDRVYFDVTENIGASHMEANSDKTPNTDIERIDDLVKQSNILPTDRVIIKMDIEGMEPEAMAGAAEFIRSRKDLRVIYEHFIEDNYRNDKALLAIADFSITDLDDANRLAIKKA